MVEYSPYYTFIVKTDGGTNITLRIRLAQDHVDYGTHKIPGLSHLQGKIIAGLDKLLRYQSTGTYFAVNSEHLSARLKLVSWDGLVHSTTQFKMTTPPELMDMAVLIGEASEQARKDQR